MHSQDPMKGVTSVLWKWLWDETHDELFSWLFTGNLFAGTPIYAQEGGYCWQVVLESLVIVETNNFGYLVIALHNFYSNLQPQVTPPWKGEGNRYWTLFSLPAGNKLKIVS